MTTLRRDDEHPSAERLLDYFEEKLSDDRDLLVEEHLAGCDSCTKVARQVNAFHGVWESWTAATHGQVYLKELLALALRDAEKVAPQWKERLRRWQQHSAGLAEAALRVLNDVSEGAARVVAKGVDALSRPGSAWQFEPVPAAIGVRGDKPGDHSSVTLTTTVAKGTPGVRVAVRAGQSGEVTVRIEGFEDEDAAPLILLISREGADVGEVRVAKVERELETDYLIARFRDVAPGNYLVVFEPLDLPGDA